jgi:hypothetical protein
VVKEAVGEEVGQEEMAINSAGSSYKRYSDTGRPKRLKGEQAAAKGKQRAAKRKQVAAKAVPAAGQGGAAPHGDAWF